MDERYKKLSLKDWVVGDNEVINIDVSNYFNLNPALIAMTEYEEDHTFYIENYNDRNKPVYPHVRFKKQGEDNYCDVIFLDKSTIEGSNKMIQLFLAKGIYDIELIYPTEISGAKNDLEANMRYYDSPAGRIFLFRTTSYKTSNANNLWCGLRIQRITSSASDGDEPILKNFFYNTSFDPNMTSGTVHFLPDYIHRYSIIYPLEVGYDGAGQYQSAGVLCVGSTAFPNSPLGNYSNIEYPEIAITLTKKDRLDPDGYINNLTEKYYYSSVRQSGNNDYNRSDFLTYQPIGERMFTSMSHRRGNLLKKIVGDRSGFNTQTTSYLYNIREYDVINEPFPILTTNAFTLCDMTRAIGWNGYGGHDYSIGKYTLIPYNKTTASETVEESNGIISEKRYEYFYDTYTSNLDYGLVKSVSSTTSEGNSVSTYYTYLHGNINGEYMFLPEQETEVTVVDGKTVSAVRNEYDPVTRLLLRKYELPDNYNSGRLLSTNQRTTAAQTQAISELAYEYRYNGNGNLIEIKYRGIPLASYLWGYNGLYPVIEAAGVSYDTLRAGLLSAGMTAQQIDGRAIDTQMQIKTVSDRLRSSLPEATISSIAYHWLLGIIEMTDGTGRSTTYDYDTRGRLVEVRDFNNYLIQKYNYNTYSYGQN